MCEIGTDLEGVVSWYGMGGIMGQMKTRLIFINGNLNAQRYINQVLAAETIPFLQRHGLVTLQQNNARPHTAAVTCNHLAANNINVMA